MMNRITRVEGRVMSVNSYLLHGPEGIVVIDGMLTVGDAALVREAIDESGRPLAGVVVTHAHPDHYAGAGLIIGPADVPIVATSAVAEVIRRDDPVKDQIVGAMMGDQWPAVRAFPNRLVESGEEVYLGGVELTVESLGPGESPADSLWRLDPATVFPGDIASNRSHAYLADGYWEEWISCLDRLERSLDADATLYVGHGPPGSKELLAAQRHYIETFVNNVIEHADAIAAGDHGPVVNAMKELLSSDELSFLMELSIEPVLAGLGDRSPLAEC